MRHYLRTWSLCWQNGHLPNSQENALPTTRRGAICGSPFLPSGWVVVCSDSQQHTASTRREVSLVKFEHTVILILLWVIVTGAAAA